MKRIHNLTLIASMLVCSQITALGQQEWENKIENFRKVYDTYKSGETSENRESLLKSLEDIRLNFVNENYIRIIYVTKQLRDIFPIARQGGIFGEEVSQQMKNSFLSKVNEFEESIKVEELKPLTVLQGTIEIVSHEGNSLKIIPQIYKAKRAFTKAPRLSRIIEPESNKNEELQQLSFLLKSWEAIKNHPYVTAGGLTTAATIWWAYKKINRK